MRIIIAVVIGLAAAAVICGNLKFLFKTPSFMEKFAFPYRYDNADAFTAGNTTISTRVKKLDIDWITGNITVRYHDEDTVLVSETSRFQLDDDTRLRWNLDDETLSIRFAKSGARLRPDLDKNIFVTLPRRAETEEAVISDTTGDIFINGGTWKVLDIHAVTGFVHISADIAEALTASSITGNVAADVRSAGSIDLKCTTGDVDLSAGSFDSLMARVTTGDIRAHLPEDPGFTAKLSATTGNVVCRLPHIDDGKIYTVGDGSRAVEMKAVTGNVTITG
ncbi:MAG: DUF4097 family beta strand repeat protein [Oscillospiraceae bacterium]|nr:DUF4097 family beta strand repeat protein [Oscillospiraceae bacterium]